MRVLHIIPTVDPAGGGPVEGILRTNEASAGVREIVTCDPPTAPFLRDFPIRVHAVGDKSVQVTQDIPIWHRYGFCRQYIPWLRNNVAKYDAVIVNGLWNFATFAASRVLPGSGVPYFVFPHGMMDPWFRRTYPTKHAVKQLLWLFSEGKLLSRARAVLFTTEEECRLAKDGFWGWSYNEVIVNYGTTPPPRPTDEQTAAFQNAVPRLRGRPYLLFLSRIHKKKGLDLLIEAFAHHARHYRDLDLVIAGPDQGDLGRDLGSRAAGLGVAERIHWAGMVAGPAKWGAIYGAEAFILPSHQENFGIAVAEALACGRPVLISDKVNIWREIEQDGAGLVGSDTVDGTISMLDRYLRLTPQEQAQMSTAAASCFASRFNIQANAAVLDSLIRSHMAVSHIRG